MVPNKGIIAFLLAIAGLSSAQELNKKLFPEDFLFGVASAAYQVEGAWNESDKSESIWDYLTHHNPELIIDKSNGDIACDSYHHIDEDIALMQHMGVHFYRFSIAWTRLMPNPFSTKISEDGLKYYNTLIDALIAAEITPVVTIYHWDLPQELQKLGGWVNPIIADYYGNYARACFESFGDRVKYWVTFNEPSLFCSGYGNTGHAPVDAKLPGFGEYLCVHTMLKSHAKAYHIYDDDYRNTQKGEIGITLTIAWHEPNSTSDEDIAAANKAMQFRVGLYAHPIFAKEGDYPEIVKESVAARSRLEGCPFSRLPNFTAEEIKYIQGTSDFFGLNHYTTLIVAAGPENPIGAPNIESDISVLSWHDDSWKPSASPWLFVVPWGFRKVLNWISNEYVHPIYITENGYSDHGEMDDCGRVNYFQTYLSAVLDAIDDGANVKGYTAWSLMDNFEWLDGYVNRFGMHSVNMSDPARTRTIKKSGEFIKNVIATRTVIIDDPMFCD